MTQSEVCHTFGSNIFTAGTISCSSSNAVCSVNSSATPLLTCVENVITEINMYSTYYSTTHIPLPDIATLLGGKSAALRHLDLGYNYFSSSIPSSYASFSNLRYFDIDSNFLNGTLPTFLGQYTNVEIFSVAGNSFYGTIPSELGSLVNCINFQMNANLLGGPIPPSFGELNLVSNFFLDTNSLVGKIPTTFSKLTQVTHLTLYSNSLTGTIPSFLSSYIYLTVLDVNSNSFSGKIPSELGRMSRLQYLDLSNNGLTGTIPASLCGMASLTYLGLGGNRGLTCYPPCLTTYGTSVIDVNALNISRCTPSPTAVPTNVPSTMPTVSHPPTMTPTALINQLQITSSVINCYSSCSANVSAWTLRDFCSFYSRSDCNSNVSIASYCPPKCLSSCPNIYCNTFSYFFYGCDGKSATATDVHKLSASCTSSYGDYSATTTTYMNFTVELTLSGIVANLADSDKDVVSNSVAQFMALGASSLISNVEQVVTAGHSAVIARAKWGLGTKVAATFTIQGVRSVASNRLLEAGRKLSGSSLVFTIFVEVTLEYFGYQSTQYNELYNLLTGRLNTAVSSGTFLTSIQNQDPNYDGASVSNPVYSAPLVTFARTNVPTSEPSVIPTMSPTASPTFKPTSSPTSTPTFPPSAAPSRLPTLSPTAEPSAVPTATPSLTPTAFPTKHGDTTPPTNKPSALPSTTPSVVPTNLPTFVPTTTKYVTQSEVCHTFGSNIFTAGTISCSSSNAVCSVNSSATPLLTCVENVITEINMYSTYYSTTHIPLPDIATLLGGKSAALRHLDLGYNYFSSSIPSSYASFSNLRYFDIDSNFLNGTLPTFLGQYTNVEIFSVAGNSFYGTIPSELGSLVNCINFQMNANLLGGPIPPSFGELNLVSNFFLDTNSLVGKIPTTFSKLTQVTHLTLYSNSLTGTIPSFLSSYIYLTVLDVNSNSFSGKIPSELGRMSRLQYLDLSNNGLTGTIPASLCGMASLTYLGLGGNRGLTCYPPCLTTYGTSVIDVNALNISRCTPSPTAVPTNVPSTMPTVSHPPTMTPTALINQLQITSSVINCYSSCSANVSAWTLRDFCSFYSRSDCNSNVSIASYCPPKCLSSCPNIYCNTFSYFFYGCDGKSATATDVHKLSASCTSSYGDYSATTTTYMNFTVELTLSGIVANLADSDKDVVSNSVAQFMALGASSLISNVEQVVTAGHSAVIARAKWGLGTKVAATFTIQGVRSVASNRLLEAGRKLSGSSLVFTIFVEVTLEYFGYQSTQYNELYNLLTGRLNTAVSSGTFLTSIQNQDPNYDGASVSNPVYSAPLVTFALTTAPTSEPSANPTKRPTASPTFKPTSSPTSVPTSSPSAIPTYIPTTSPTSTPTSIPTVHPTRPGDTNPPTPDPTAFPSPSPSTVPTNAPTSTPTTAPTASPSSPPTSSPSSLPTSVPSSMPTVQPSSKPSSAPTYSPTNTPTSQPTSIPSTIPTYMPSSTPSVQPSSTPTGQPTGTPTAYPSSVPSGKPTEIPTAIPTDFPSVSPTMSPTAKFYYSANGCPIEVYILDRWGDGWGGAILTASNAQYISLPDEEIHGFFPSYGHYGKSNLIVIDALATSTLSISDVISGPPEEYWEVR